MAASTLLQFVNRTESSMTLWAALPSSKLTFT